MDRILVDVSRRDFDVIDGVTDDVSTFDDMSTQTREFPTFSSREGPPPEKTTGDSPVITVKV